MESTYSRWRSLYPSGVVVTRNTGFDRDYDRDVNPYGNYAEIDNPQVLFPVRIDASRPPKERALGIPDGDGGRAYAFGSLREAGAKVVVHEVIAGQEMVVLWDDFGDIAAAYYPFAGGQDLTFFVENAQIFDAETGSLWSVTGRSISGPLTGETLEAVPDAFVAYWFAWPSLYPNIQLWSAP